jgi:hypothetical protein
LILPDGITCACESGQWERRPGDGGTIICCARCGTIAAIVSEGGAEHSPGVSLHEVTLTMCSLCLNGEGGQCHTPGCAFWLKAAPDIPMYLEPRANGAHAMTTTAPAGHASPHFMRHPITDDDWCQCPCDECCGHVEGLEGLDCLCGACGCHKPLDGALS